MTAYTYATFPILSVLIALPLVAAVLLWLVKPLQEIARIFGLVLSLIELGIGVGIAVAFNWNAAGKVQFFEYHSWIRNLGASYAVGLNGLGLCMVLLALLLVPVVLLAAWNTDALKPGFVAWVLALESFMVLIFAARDLLLFYVCFEAMLLPVYFLIGLYGGEKRRAAALKFLLYSLAGGLIMLVGVVCVSLTAENTDGLLFEKLAGSVGAAYSGKAQLAIFLSFFLAFAIKAPMWPLHTWLTDTTEQATPGTSTLLVGVLDKVGTYGMLVICVPLFPQATVKAAPYIMIAALFSIIIGAFVAVGQNNLMRLIAYTSVSHFGFMVMAIYSGVQMALAGAMLYMVAHGIATSAMFLATGMLKDRGGSYLISNYGGWQRVTPLLAGIWLISGLASIALPGLSGFVPEYLTLMGTFQACKPVAIVALVGVIVAALYVLLPYQKVFTGSVPLDITNVNTKEDDAKSIPDLHFNERVVAGVLVVAMFVLGFFPNLVLRAVDPAAQEISKVMLADTKTNTHLQDGGTK